MKTNAKIGHFYIDQDSIVLTNKSLSDFITKTIFTNKKNNLTSVFSFFIDKTLKIGAEVIDTVLIKQEALNLGFSDQICSLCDTKKYYVLNILYTGNKK